MSAKNSDHASCMVLSHLRERIHHLRLSAPEFPAGRLCSPRQQLGLFPTHDFVHDPLCCSGSPRESVSSNNGMLVWTASSGRSCFPGLKFTLITIFFFFFKRNWQMTSSYAGSYFILMRRNPHLSQRREGTKNEGDLMRGLHVIFQAKLKSTQEIPGSVRN